MIKLEVGMRGKRRNGEEFEVTRIENDGRAYMKVGVSLWAHNGMAWRAGGKLHAYDAIEVYSSHPAATSGAQREKLNALPYDLVPFQEIADAYSRVAEKGAVKYAPWNWSKGLSRVQLIGSLLRHTWAYLRGEECDKETGLNHTDHILWNAVALVHNVRWNLEDGRRGEPERNYKNPLDTTDKDV